MDLYEALKAGTSAEELLQAFHKDLDEANARIAEEEAAATKAKEHELYLSDCRKNLAIALSDYINAYFDEDQIVLSTDEIEKTLIDFEKELDFSSNGVNVIIKDINLNEAPTKTHKITSSLGDDDIIERFIKSLK